MQEYDRTLKVLFQSAATQTLRALTGESVARWLNVELPEVQRREVDLLGQTPEGELLHLELQSTNDPAMPLRMAEYCLAILRHQDHIPRQIVVYVGREPLVMASELRRYGLQFSYELIDMRQIDAEPLLASTELSDNVIGILGRVADPRNALRRILARIANTDVDERLTYLRALLLVSGLRGLAEFAEVEVKTVPVLIDIMDNPVFAREYRKGVAVGLEEGLEQGQRKGEATLLRRLLEARFGPLPSWVESRLAEASLEQIESWGVELLSAHSLDSLLGPES